jgi:putative transposon-encoded protein
VAISSLTSENSFYAGEISESIDHLFEWIEKDLDVPADKKPIKKRDPMNEAPQGKVKFEVYGEEMIEKRVRLSGNSGRVYLPPDWVDHQVKIIRID